MLALLSFSWQHVNQIVGQVRKMDLEEPRKEQYVAVFLLAAATRLRCGELFALRGNDIDFKAGTILVDESADQQTYQLGPSKNAAAYRTVLLADIHTPVGVHNETL
jgi:integrase